MHDTIETIDAYLNSKHTSGAQDAMGRDKPFFNIVSAAVNIWYRATDIDRKNIRLMPEGQETVALAFMASVLLQRWMRTARFGVFLNEWGRSLARYGSAVVKFVEKNGELSASVIPWNRFIADAIDFDAIPRIEKFYKTASQLRNMATSGHPDYAGYDEGQVDELVNAMETRKTLDKQQQDTQNNFIELYEVHGVLPTYMLDKDPKPVEDKDVRYSQQMHVISYVETEGGDVADFTLFKGKEKRDPYMLTHLIREDGRTLSIGAVEYILEAQWIVNHTMKNEKDYLDLVSKVIISSTDGSLQGKNVLSNLETGDLIIHSPNTIVQPLAMGSGSLDQLMNFGTQWRQMAQDLTSTPDALRGNTLPSGTPYSLAAYQGQQANSLFEIMTENKGLSIEDMINEFVLPHLRKQMDNKDEVVALLDEQGIAEIDAMWIPKAAIKKHNDEVKKALLNAPVDSSLSNEHMPQPFDQAKMEGQVRQSLGSLGNKRIFKPDEFDKKTWKDVLDEYFENAHAVVEVTNENTDKQAVLTTLSSLLQSIATNPAILQNPDARLIFNQILTQTGNISPIQLSAVAAQPAPAPAAGPPSAGLPVTATNGIQ